MRHGVAPLLAGVAEPDAQLALGSSGMDTVHICCKSGSRLGPSRPHAFMCTLAQSLLACVTSALISWGRYECCETFQGVEVCATCSTNDSPGHQAKHKTSS